MALYAPDAELRSPMVVRRLVRSDGTLRGHAELRPYVRRGLDEAPALRFEPLVVSVGLEGMCLVYRRETGVTVCETFLLDPIDAIARADVHYDRPV